MEFFSFLSQPCLYNHTLVRRQPHEVRRVAGDVPRCLDDESGNHLRGASLPRPRRPYRGGKYPWIKWFSQGVFTLVRGVDYQIRTDSMIQQIRSRASTYYSGIRLAFQVAEDGNSITVRVREQSLPKLQAILAQETSGN